MLRPPTFPALLALLILSSALPAQAQWKWRDAAGKLQYSDLPPPKGTPEKDILQSPPSQQSQRVIVRPLGTAVDAASAPSPVASGPSRAEQEQQARQKQQDKDSLAKLKDEERRLAEQRRENCSRAQDNLKLLQDGVRLTRPNERGEPILIDERQRAEELQRTRGVISSECR